MYILFRHFKMDPRVYYGMKDGEQVVIRAFVSKWADEMEDMQRKIDQAGRE